MRATSADDRRCDRSTRSAPPINTRRQLSRRHFLRGSGAVMIALPILEAMSPPLMCMADDSRSVSPKRFVAMCATLGFHGEFLFPRDGWAGL